MTLFKIYTLGFQILKYRNGSHVVWVLFYAMISCTQHKHFLKALLECNKQLLNINTHVRISYDFGCNPKLTALILFLALHTHVY